MEILAICIALFTLITSLILSCKFYIELNDLSEDHEILNKYTIKQIQDITHKIDNVVIRLDNIDRQSNSDLCHICKNKILHTHGSVLNDVHYLFCSEKCKNEFLFDHEHKEKNKFSVIYKCNFCSRKFDMSPIEKEGSKFCSDECSIRIGLNPSDNIDIMLGKKQISDFI